MRTNLDFIPQKVSHLIKISVVLRVPFSTLKVFPKPDVDRGF